MNLAWILLGGIALWALIRLGRQAERGRRGGQWRVSATLFSAVALGAAAILAVRGAWLFAGVAATAGLWLATASRHRVAPPRTEGMSEAEARSLLGVTAKASDAEIRAAYRRLMARAHPDTGGTEGLAARLNAARDRLLKPTGRG